MASQALPSLNIAASKVVVKVHAIDTTLRLIGITANAMWNPPITGFDRFRAGTWAFLIEHPAGRKLLYDLGLRKDWTSLSPCVGLQEAVRNGVIADIKVKKNIAETLVEAGVRLEEIEGIIWSHFHWDHTGDPSTFPLATALIVGPGTIENFLPGYPIDPTSHILESDYAGRELLEVDFSKTPLRVGPFKAVDWFGDGSFYLLDSPGHAIGHMNALARTAPSPSSNFIHLCGDSAHHVGEIRPSMHDSLPESIDPSPLPHLYQHQCPGDIFTPVLRSRSRADHILEFQEPPGYHKGEQKYAVVYNERALRDTIRKIEHVDGDADIFTVLAHDWSLKGLIDEFPASLNGWKEKGWREKSRWKFLADFESAIVEQTIIWKEDRLICPSPPYSCKLQRS